MTKMKNKALQKTSSAYKRRLPLKYRTKEIKDQNGLKAILSSRSKRQTNKNLRMVTLGELAYFLVTLPNRKMQLKVQQMW